jgi:hypothetical protein
MIQDPTFLISTNPGCSLVIVSNSGMLAKFYKDKNSLYQLYNYNNNNNNNYNYNYIFT